MDLSQTVYMVIGSSFGIIGGTIFAVKYTENKRLQTVNAVLSIILIVFGAVLGRMLYKNMVLPILFTHEIQELESGTLYLSVIREHDPEAYARIIKPYDRMLRNGDITPEGVNLFRSRLDQELIKKQATASAKQLRIAARSDIQGYQELKISAPEICTRILQGRSYWLLGSFLSRAALRRQDEIISSYYTYSPRPPDYIPDLERGEALVNTIIDDSIIASEIETFDPPNDGTPESILANEKICDYLTKVSVMSNELSDEDLLHFVSFSHSQ